MVVNMNICRVTLRKAICLPLKISANPSILSYRNTYVVKRMFPPPLSRVNAERLRKLKAKHFIYELVEDKNLTESPDIHVVLTTFVDGIGDVGDVISVTADYGRNQLLLPQKAAYATPDNVRKYTELKKNRPERPKYSSIHVGGMVRCLSKSVIPVCMNSEVPWTIGKDHLEIAFRMEGFNVPKDVIELPPSPIKGPNLLNDAKDFVVYITINNRERVPIRCRLLHIKIGDEKTPLSEEFYLDKADPILDEQIKLLDEMPMPEIMNDPSMAISLIEKYRIQFIK